MREERVPCDVIHVDPYWMRYHEGHHGDLEWDESAFPDPEGMIAELKALGFRLSLWVSPYVPLDSEMRADGEHRGFLMKSKSSSPSPSGGRQPILPSPSGGGQGGGLALWPGFA